MSSHTAVTTPDEQLESREEAGYIHVSTPSGSEQDAGRPHHRRPPKHVRALSRQMQTLQEGYYNLSIQQNVINANMMQKVNQDHFWELAGKVESLMCTFQVLQQELQKELVNKAAVDQVPTNEAFQQLQSIVATKAALHQVPTHETLGQLMQAKADVDQVPTNEAFEQLKDDVATKVTADQVPSNDVFEKLQKDVLTKAAADQVPTKVAFERLQKDVALKTYAHQVPTDEAFQQLKTIVGSKADAKQVSTVEDLKQLQNEVAAKAAMNQVPTNEAFQQLQDVVATKAAASSTPTHATLRQLLANKADVDQVPTNDAFERLRNDVATKAAADQVPTNADLDRQRDHLTMLTLDQDLKHEIVLQKFQSDVPTLEAFEQLESRLLAKESCIFTMSSDGKRGNSGRMIWNMLTKHAPFQIFDEECIFQKNGAEHVVIVHAGVYKVDVQILPSKGCIVYPFIEVDNESVMYGYGGTDAGYGYSAANMSALLQLTAGACISVNFQHARGNVYKNPFGVLHNRHNLVIIRIS
mmetsp:Transcript_130825/g.252082  ORF Transcript_130825/g.252082 Transcript_130825/m.252082 type:complete len:525 (+) Transcript_130825:66-1640(+)